MLFAPPPGYNSAAINRQDPSSLTTPGPQGGPAQGYFNQYRSSFAYPSSYTTPSSMNKPDPWYQQKPPQNPAQMQMAQALMGTKPS